MLMLVIYLAHWNLFSLSFSMREKKWAILQIDIHMKSQSNDRNIAGRNMLRAFSHPVEKCCEMFVIENRIVRMPGRNNDARTWPNDYNIMQHPQMCGKFKHFKIWTHNAQYVTTSRNRVAKRAQHAVTCCTQQCRDMLRWYVAIVWP